MANTTTDSEIVPNMDVGEEQKRDDSASDNANHDTTSPTAKTDIVPPLAASVAASASAQSLQQQQQLLSQQLGEQQQQQVSQQQQQVSQQQQQVSQQQQLGEQLGEQQQQQDSQQHQQASQQQPQTSQQQPTSHHQQQQPNHLGATRPTFVQNPNAPLLKLSVDLIKTYKHINKVYYEAKRKRQLLQDANQAKATEKHGEASHDDENFDYRIQLNERLHNRYIVKARIGKGSFGQVVRAFDTELKRDVAIKIIKSKKPFYRQAKTEIELLQKLNASDPEDMWYIVRLLDTFLHHRHQCLVFEMLSYNLYDLLRNTNYNGVSLNLIKKFARQILKALFHLSKKEIDIIHCDLKPENILLRHPKRSAIKVIDFGSSCNSNKKLYTYIQSRFYRSPEVMLGLPYSVSIDMWSLGCILVEMHTGEPLFSGSDEHDQMIRLVAVLGMPPVEMLDAGTKTSNFFTKVPAAPDPDAAPGNDDSRNTVYQLKPRKLTTAKEEILAHAKTLEEILGTNGDGPGGRRKGETGHSIQNYANFLDLVKGMLQYDPKKRLHPFDALKHVIFKEQVVVKQPRKQPGSLGMSVVHRAVVDQSSSRRREPYLARRGSSSSGRTKRPGSAPANISQKR